MKAQVSNNLIKHEQKGNKFGQKPERLKIFENIALFVCHDQQEKRLNRMVNIAHIFRLNVSMLLSSSNKLGESC